jgi:oxygen-dependent protoporphyrinogen oxidase
MSKVVLGGGLGGLAAAHYLTKKAATQTLTLIESSSRTGGWIKTNLQENGTVFEQGPRTIRPRGEAGSNTLELVEELNLTDQIVPLLSSHPAAQNRMIYANGSLHLLPSSLFGLFKKQEPFTRPLVLHLLNDLKAKKKSVQDESIYEFVDRRFGKEVADYLISPLICGICAGNAQEISVKFLMRKLFEYEQQYGSISKGMVQNFSLKSKKATVLNGLVLKAKKEKWNIYSFISGCETLPLALKESILKNNVNLKLNSECTSMTIGQNNVTLHLSNKEVVTADYLISAIPARNLGMLLQKQYPDLAHCLLNLVKNVSVAVVNLEFKNDLIKNSAFGLLVAPKEELPVLGVIYDSCCFPKENGGTVLTVMMGGYWFEKYFGKNPNEKTLLNIALNQVKQILSIHDIPVRSKVNILHHCLPQYVVGHDDNLSEINNYIKTHQLPISLCGSSYYGVGINDVIMSAKTAVNKLIFI